MARPVKWRKVEATPVVTCFTPTDGIEEGTEENQLKLEELEAIRLKDLLGLEQEECAVRMEVSRPTFQRILLSAREKVADSLLNGKAIRIEGGNFTRNICPVRCKECGKEWKESFENFEEERMESYACPSCGSEHVICQSGCSGKFCRKNCNKRKNEA